MIRIVALFALLLTWTCHVQTGEADEPTEPDTPKAEADSLVELHDGWRWDRPVPDHAERHSDAIQLRTEAGRIWAGEGSQNRIITEEPMGDFAKVFAEIEIPASHAQLSLQVNGSKVTGVWRSNSSQPWRHAAETQLRHEKTRHFAVFSQDGDPANPRYALARGLRQTRHGP